MVDRPRETYEVEAKRHHQMTRKRLIQACCLLLGCFITFGVIFAFIAMNAKS